MSSPPPLPARKSFLLVPLSMSGPLVPTLLTAKAAPPATTNVTATNTASVAALLDNGSAVLRISLHLSLFAGVLAAFLLRTLVAHLALGRVRCIRASVSAGPRRPWPVDAAVLPHPPRNIPRD